MERCLLILGYCLLLVWMPMGQASCASSSDTEATPSRSNLVCQLHHSRIRDKQVTELGDVYIYEVVGQCQNTGRWEMRAFHDDDHRGTMTMQYMENKPTSVSVEFHEPYWLRFTASDGDSTRSWDYIARQNEEGRWMVQQCYYSLPWSRTDRAPQLPQQEFGLPECLEPYLEENVRNPVWNRVAVTVLRDPQAFGQQLFAMIDDRADDAEFLSWLAMFVDQTWDDFDDEGRQRATAAMDQIPCETVMGSDEGVWKRFVNAGRSALGDDFSRMVSPCDRMLLQDIDSELRKIRHRLEDPAMLSRIDDQVASFVDAGDQTDDALLQLWGLRLAYDPPPDQTLVDRMDRVLVDGRHFDPLIDRLDSGVPIDETLREYLREELTQCCDHYHKAKEILEHSLVQPP